MKFLAHAGHDHAEEEAAVAIPLELLLSAGLVAGGVLLWLVATYLIKLSLPARLLTLAVYMLGVGVTAFQAAPVMSIVAIAGGLALTLGLTLLQLMGQGKK